MKTEKKNKLKDLLKRLNTLEGSLPIGDTKDFLDRMLKDETNKFVSSFKDNPTVKYLDGFNTKLEQFKHDFRLEPIISAIEKIQGDVGAFQESSSQEFSKVSKTQEDKYNELVSLLKKSESGQQNTTSQGMNDLASRIEKLQSELSFQSSDTTKKGQSLNTVLSGIEQKIETALQGLKSEGMGRESLGKSLETKLKEKDKAITKTVSSIEELRQQMLTMMANRGGGSMNRQIFIGGADPLKTYTDINLKAGTNVTITYANNNTTKKVDVTITSTGGGGGGTVRSINSISTPQTAGSTAGTDYVYLITGTTQLTMPTAVGNTNLYTIKNVGTGVVTVAFAGIETCDGSTTLTLPVQYTSVDIISDTVNWNIT